MQLVRLDEPQNELAQERHVLVDPDAQGRVEITLGLEPGADTFDVAGRLGEQTLHQLGRVAPVGFGRDEPRLSEQIIELEGELSGIVPLGVEREGLGKDRRVSLAVIALEADLAGVEREREPERDIQPLDAQLEPLESAPTALADPRGRGAQRTRFLGFSPDS